MNLFKEGVVKPISLRNLVVGLVVVVYFSPDVKMTKKQERERRQRL